MSWYAHSPDEKRKIPAQSYGAHVSGVVWRAKENVERILPYCRDNGFLYSAVAAACYHDLGKLDPENQKILSGQSPGRLPINHVDAGVRALIDQGLWESAFIAYAHHIGLQSVTKELLRGAERFRDSRALARTDLKINEYLLDHYQATHNSIEPFSPTPLGSSITRRVVFSCLVDADHSDTAAHYHGERDVNAIANRHWAERLKALENYVAGLATNRTERNMLRGEVFAACRDAETHPPIRTCESPVGTGKTTAVMAHLLKVAKQKDLRHIIVVLPFTNIIKQSVKVYREALSIPGEDPFSVVAEHHHQVDFRSHELRHLAELWRAPIIVTTAVQFFQTLTGNMPAVSRKLHELPGSAVFIDEAHAAIPTWLWPSSWELLKELAGEWSCHFVLGSGSLARFWHFPEFVKQKEEIPDLIPHDLAKRCFAYESVRITPQTLATPLDLEGLIDFVLSKKGPRLVIMNTVQSAAVIAHRLQKGRQNDVLHLSTALAPIDRENIVAIVETRLKDKSDSQWTLVATSCVEAGMNFSFQSAFREGCTTASLIQIGGRVNRNADRIDAELWDFRVSDALLNSNPAFEVPRKVLSKLFDEGSVQKSLPADLVTEAMRRELMVDDRLFGRKVEAIRKAEDALDYPEIAKLCRVIDTDTYLVIVRDDIRKRVLSGEADSREISRNSVQIWAKNVRKLPIVEIQGKDGLFFWTADYDSEFLGYMKGVMPLLYGEDFGGFIV